MISMMMCVRFMGGWEEAEKQTWAAAELQCLELDSALVVVDDTTERDWLATRYRYCVPVHSG